MRHHTLLLLSLALNTIADGAPLVVDSLSVGAAVGAGSNTVTLQNSAAIGSYNNVIGSASVAIGMGNAQAGMGTATIGFYNELGSYGSVAVGSMNELFGTCSAVFGMANQIQTDEESFGGEACFIAGSYNLSHASYNSFIGGTNNVIEFSSNAFTLGQGLISRWNESFICGRFNEDNIQRADLLFCVGNGTASQRKNALEVFADGQIRIPSRQGDILMGEFGN